MTQKQRATRSILVFALSGAIGFGVGGIIGAIMWGYRSPSEGQSFLSIALNGAMGGASLGLVLQGWKKAGVAALVGAISFSAATFIGVVIQLVLWGFEPPPYFAGLFIGAIIGIFFGASLGLAFNGLKTAGLLALAGAIGFGVWFQAVSNLVFEVSSAKSFGIWGAIAGATLGVALGYLEKRKANRETQPG